MSRTFTAIYYDELNHFYNATIFISSVTLTMRYRDETGREIDRHWLGDNIVSLDENELQSTLIYKNERGMPERLLIRDNELLRQVKHEFRHQRFAGNRLHAAAGRTRYRVVSILGMILLFLAAVYFLFVPWLGERIAMKFSKEREINLGEQMYRGMIADDQVDQYKTKLINQFYQELHYKVDYPIQITVVKSDEVNAFAVPGGHIVVFDGILESMKSPGELAALLGHEASHIELRHSLRNIFRSTARKMFLLILFGGDAGIAGYLVNRADDLKGLQYSRKLETQADDNGITLMKKAGVDPNGMLDLMNLLQKEASGRETSALLSTHPVFESRIKNIRQQVKEDATRETINPRLSTIFHDLYESENSY